MRDWLWAMGADAGRGVPMASGGFGGRTFAALLTPHEQLASSKWLSAHRTRGAVRAKGLHQTLIMHNVPARESGGRPPLRVDLLQTDAAFRSTACEVDQHSASELQVVSGSGGKQDVSVGTHEGSQETLS